MNHKRAAIAILGAEIAMAASFALAGITGLSGHAQASTGCFSEQWQAMECPPSIPLSEIHRIDLYPVCANEDGSGSELPCIWTNDGNAWLTFADHSLLIVDDTVTP